ncbi:uncharacterized protein G2W53_033544 [Senna tora]|uniref:Uncharacterized protein n=1 Tax=Senna tora TaxID=362788 RepID=A0A834W8I8_9FABA|nr:uncharacterized protein G2W53_033544 [Senna tora]
MGLVITWKVCEVVRKHILNRNSRLNLKEFKKYKYNVLLHKAAMEGRLQANLAGQKMSELLEEADQGGGKVVIGSISIDPSILSIAQHQTAGLSKVFHHDDTPPTALTLANQVCSQIRFGSFNPSSDTPAQIKIPSPNTKPLSLGYEV